MAYLDDNPPRHQQFRCPRRERPSGIISVHTAESHPDESGPDTGAESVARFIRDRTSYGSYHLLADSDSIVQLIEFRCVAYHIATHGLNEHTIGISAATQAAKWNSLSSGYRDAMVRNMARAAARAAEWLHEHYGITVPARRISLAQARRGERGFLAHGDADPDRRTDPGATFPWDDFLSYYADEMSGGTVSYDDIWRTDGKMDGPRGKAPDDNRKWWPESVLEHVGHALHQHAEKPNEPGKSWPPRLFWKWGYAHAAMGRQAAESADEKLDVLLAAQEGLDTDAILERIDQRHAEAQQQRDAIAETMTDRLDAIAEALEGSDPAEAKLAAIAEVLGVEQDAD